MNKYYKRIPLKKGQIKIEAIDFKNLDMFKLFDTLIETYCEEVSMNKYIKTLKKIGEYVDEARDGYGLDHKEK